MRHVPLALLLLAASLPLAIADAAPQPDWPTVERQLAADRVAPGTPLAELIRDNQDFALLRPEEARDRIPVPLWLRVYWRKAHPEMRSAPGDPTGGYPLVLKELHEWMVSHPDLEHGVERMAAAARKPPKPVVTVSGGPDQRISPEESTPHSESDIRVSFWDPSRIVSASNDISGTGSLGIYYSGDGGATWRQTYLPKRDEGTFQSDPAVEWTSDGTAWAVTLAVDSSSRTLKAHAFRSADGGATWTFDAVLSGDQEMVDKEMIWVDHSDGSPFKDNLYVIWHNGDEVIINRRSGADGSWGDPIRVSGPETTGTGIGSDVKANRIGQVFAFWPDTGSRKIFFTRSLNGGASYSRPAQVARTFASFDVGVPAQARRRTLLYVTGGAFYRSAKKNMVYLAWMDFSGSRTCNGPEDEPGFSRTAPCQTRIWFTRSSNGGNSWQAPRMINNPAGLNDQFNPWLAVDEATGALAIAYYDTIGEARNLTNLWAQASLDDGATWSAPYRVTSEPSDASLGAANGNQYGDYNGLSGFGGTFFPSWTDRRGRSEQVWTAPLTVRSGRARAGLADSAAPLCPFRSWSPEELAQPLCSALP
jgi:hypothetical protein